MLTKIETEYTRANRTAAAADYKSFSMFVEQTCFRVSFASIKDAEEILRKIKEACECALESLED